MIKIIKKRKSGAGFTLLELLIVIAIVGILSSIMIIAFPGYVDKARLANSFKFSDNIKGSLRQDTIVWYKFDETSGTVAKDAWWDQLHGTLIGGPTWIDGIMNNALSFDGVDDFVRVLDNNILDTNGSFTLAMWFYNRAGTKSYPTLLNRANQYGTNGFFWIFTGGVNEADLNFQWANGSGRNEVFSGVLKKDVWQYIVFTFNNITKSLELFVDGKKQSTARTLTGYLPVDDGILYIGTYAGGTSAYPVYGYIDDLSIFSSNLSQSAIDKYYAQGLKKHQNLLAEN